MKDRTNETIIAYAIAFAILGIVGLAELAGLI